MLTLHGKKWFYKGEGNANVVLAVPEDGTVVRVMKDDSSGDEPTKTLWMRVAYCDIVQRLFFGHEYVDVPVPMLMSAEELCEIDRRIRRNRPSNRTHKGLGPGPLVAVCPDYTTTVWPLLRTDSGQAPRVYCVEIKPKQGWLHEDDRTVIWCAFCAHQYLKLSRGDVREISRYCPLDLFSGRRERVERAIRGLLRSPQNNLKMFRDGVLLDGDNLAWVANEALGDGDRFCAFVAAILLGDFSNRGTTAATTSEYQRPDEDGDARQPCDFDAVPMPPHCVLDKVLKMQKLQTAGFTTVLSAYKQLLPKITVCNQFDHVYRLQRSMLALEANAATMDLVDGYLVAATARDCSVYVTFCREADGDILFDGYRYTVSVKVSDLDPKPFSTVDKHRKRNADVLFACEQYSQSRK